MERYGNAAFFRYTSIVKQAGGMRHYDYGSLHSKQVLCADAFIFRQIIWRDVSVSVKEEGWS